MRKTLNIILICLISSSAFAQENSIQVEYKVSSQKSTDEEKIKNLSPEMQEMVKSKVAKLKTENKNLLINGSLSKYSAAEEIGDMGSTGQGVQIITMKSGATSEEIYKNTTANFQSMVAVINDKKFLIEEPLRKLNWNITAKTKTLGNYNVQQATTQIDGQEVTAWFTKTIKSNQGPDIYWGLPGLILEVETPTKHILADQITTTAKATLIAFPKQGKKVTQEEFNKISEQKKKQLLDMYQNNTGL